MDSFATDDRRIRAVWRRVRWSGLDGERLGDGVGEASAENE
ncbi:hypothetical protein ACFQET_00635 [Levilactobacillus tangyuanensis]|uniref:Uncharacterized protein n=1 Tax=Levilactobacillus tangyuanensis TaxID=2486021 RepID=A0ABW1TKI6_9LACO|nr:hypothetical protein [Levilactobacillus tangyuanensis]